MKYLTLECKALSRDTITTSSATEDLFMHLFTLETATNLRGVRGGMKRPFTKLQLLPRNSQGLRSLRLSDQFGVA